MKQSDWLFRLSAKIQDNQSISRLIVITLFQSSVYYEISKKSTAIPIILGITFPVRREELRARRPVGHQMDSIIILMAQDGEFGVWATLN
jgi:hypothetical protein